MLHNSSNLSAVLLQGGACWRRSVFCVATNLIILGFKPNKLGLKPNFILHVFMYACVFSLCPDSSDEIPVHDTDGPMSDFSNLDAPSQWHIVTSIMTYINAFDSRTDREMQKRQLVNPYPWLKWMEDDDVAFMLHARSNQKAWSLFQTRGSDGQKVAYEKWLEKFNANPTSVHLKPSMKEHVMGAKYVRHVKLTTHVLFVYDYNYLYTRLCSWRF
jgi:hypothetical protein